MKAKRKRRRSCGWQLGRLMAFAQSEREDSRFYELGYEKTARNIPFKVLTVMLFFLKEEYARKPGSLVTLYRVAHGDGCPCPDFEKRYEAYYCALQERGYL